MTTAVKAKYEYKSARAQGFLSALLVALAVTDGLITRFILENGLGREGNPFMTFWVNDGSFLTIKFVGTALAGALLWYLQKRLPRVVLYLSLAVIVYYAAIVWWNVSVAVIGLTGI